MWTPESYTVAASLFPRLLGLIYFFAIGAFFFQIRGLLGQNGILPIVNFLNHFRNRSWGWRIYHLPTLFWLNSSDRTLMGTVVVGVFISIMLVFGYFPVVCLALLFIIHLSIVTTGQEFLGFGWESLLLEITFYAFLTALTPIPNLIAWINLNFLLFRFHLQAGAVKLQSRDPTWRALTAVAYHYLSQPLPNMWAWYAYKWPISFQKASTLFMFIVELIIPFGLYFTDTIRAVTGMILILFQVILWATGNFSYLNHMTAAFCIIALPNFIFPSSLEPELYQIHWLPDTMISLVAFLFLIMQGTKLWLHFRPYNPLLASWLAWTAPFHLVNRFGLFAIMTTKRYEIIVEGSDDGENWKEYLCRYKPSELNRRPRRISPYQPRLDWQMWFLPFDSFEAEPWFHQFLYHLLKGNPEVLKLIRFNPFPDRPPKYIRAAMYDYQFSTKEQKHNLGWWWQREYVGLFSPVLTLR